MPASNAAAEKRSQPQILVETAGLSEKEWLAYRRKGIGGSDVAALLGISPWRTARDLYFDKLNIVAVEDNEDNWVALEMGHLLEPLVAKILQKGLGTEMYLLLQKRTALPAASSRSWWRRLTGKRSNQEFGMEWSLKKRMVN